MSAEEKKNSRVSPCFLQLKILKEPFWATWSSGGVGISIVVVVIVVVIVVVDLMSKKGGTMQKAKS
jgi:membrane protein insertase Oxa1/YidC/SpoIIIJ